MSQAPLTIMHPACSERPEAPPMPAGVRARVWIAARHFFSRADAQNRCWLWLLGDDGQVHAWVLPVHCLDRDELLPVLIRSVGTDPDEESLPGTRLEAARALPNAPVVPLPRWQVSWGHPVQRAIRDFAASLDYDVLHALGELEAPGPFFGSVENYNRIVAPGQPVRTHRMQALAEFPPLVAPVLLAMPERVDMFGDGIDAGRSPPPRNSESVLDAIDRGRDLIGALAAHYRVDRALVRSSLCRSPWASGAIPVGTLRLLAALPARARPRHAKDVEPRLQVLESLPFMAARAYEVQALASAFAQGWDQTWMRLDTLGQPLPTAFRNARDFLAAAIEQVVLPDSLAAISRERLGLAWAARRGLVSLLLASQRWHAQPLETLPQPTISAPDDTLEPLLEGIELADGRIEERLTEAALAEEGQRMHHCVVDYWDECLTAGLRIVHLQLPDGERATAAYDLLGSAHDPHFSLEQLQGPCNAEVSVAMEHLAQRVLGLLNAPERRECRVRVSEAANTAMRRIRQLPAARRTIRRLDANSRRELAQVIAWCEQQDAWKHRRGELFCGPVAGFQHAEGVRLLDRLQPDDALTLVREPDNPHDRLAVRVDWQGRKLGYVPRAQNQAAARLLDMGASLQAHIVAVNAADEPWSCVEMRIEHIESPSATS